MPVCAVHEPVHCRSATAHPINNENYGYSQLRLNAQGMAAVYADEL